MNCTMAAYPTSDEARQAKRLFQRHYSMNFFVKRCDECDCFHLCGDTEMKKYPFVKGWDRMLQLVAEGFSDKETGEMVGVKPRMVERYIEQLSSYFYASNRANLVAICISLGLLNPKDFVPQITLPPSINKRTEHERTANV